MERFQAERVKEVKLHVGDTVSLESLHQAVVPPYVMLVPYIDAPREIAVIGRHRLNEDGVHGCIYDLEVKAPVDGVISIGFKDLRTGKITHEKAITVTSYR